MSSVQSIEKQQNFERMNLLLKEKDRRIAQLLQYEYSAKKALEQKTWQQEAFEKEKLRVISLEKEKEALFCTVTESRQHIQQLERAVQFLQKRVEEILLEKHQLQEQLHDAIETTKQLSTQTTQDKELNTRLKRDLLEFQGSQEELQQELSSLYEQFDHLKLRLEAERKENASLTTFLDQSRGASESLEKEKEQLKRALHACKDEISSIKHHLTKGLRDSKELENKYSEAVTEKVLTLKTLYQFQRELDKQHQESVEIKEKLQGSLERERGERSLLEEKFAAFMQRFHSIEEELKLQLNTNAQLSEQLESLILKINLLNNEKEVLRDSAAAFQKEIEVLQVQQKQVLDRLENATHSNASFEAQNEQLKQEVEAHQAHSEEKQLQLEEAQQHLAKKVREVALLNEKMEELSRQANEEASVHAALQQANALLQGDLQKIENEKVELNKKIELLYGEIKKQEAKSQMIDKRRQLAEEKVTALEKIEQRHAQLQSLLSGFGNVLGGSNADAPEMKAHPMRAVPQFGDVLPDEEEKKTITDNPKPYPNLFDMSQGVGNSSKPKQTFFD